MEEKSAKLAKRHLVTLQLSDLARALLSAELEERRKHDSKTTQTDVVIECVVEHLARISPEMAKRVTLEAVKENPELRQVLEMVSPATHPIGEPSKSARFSQRKR